MVQVREEQIWRWSKITVHLHIKIFHDALDDIVPPNMVIEIYQDLKKINTTCSITIFPNDNHNSWDTTYSDATFYEWLFAQKKK